MAQPWLGFYTAVACQSHSQRDDELKRREGRLPWRVDLAKMEKGCEIDLHEADLRAPCEAAVPSPAKREPSGHQLQHEINP